MIHTVEFPVRHYECDAFGHLNNVQYIRYMQEAGFRASAAAGYDLTRYRAMGRHWLVRETEIEYLNPLRYGHTARIRTWIAGHRRVRALRMYEISNAATGEPAARARTDWVYLDTEALKPVRIPDEVIAAYLPGETPEPAPRRDPLPLFPDPPDGVFHDSRRVEWRDVDPEGHVNNAVYLAYNQEAGIAACAAHGWPMSRMIEEGFGILPRRHRIEYLHPARVDEPLVISTWAAGVRRSTALRYYLVRRREDGTLLTRTQSLYVWASLETGRPIRIPEAFLDDFSPNINSEKSGKKT